MIQKYRCLDLSYSCVKNQLLVFKNHRKDIWNELNCSISSIIYRIKYFSIDKPIVKFVNYLNSKTSSSTQDSMFFHIHKTLGLQQHRD